jgi:hypothetical protein
MRNGESTSFSLNPERIPPNLDSVYRMIDSLNEVNNGRMTETATAKDELKQALEMYEGLKEIQGVGPEVRATMKDLIGAIEDLQQAIGRVD